MIDITAALVKELRMRTGAGVMDCKKALVDAGGDIELGIENMRKSGAIKAAKKACNIASNGVIKTKIKGSDGFILEVNCQTEFVAKDDTFHKFVDTVLATAIEQKITNVDVLKTYFEEERIALVAKTSENISIRRIAHLKGEGLGSYSHASRIGVLITSLGANEDMIKQIAMHVAASKPEFIKPEDVSADLIKKEYDIQMAIAIQSGKTQAIAQKMVEGRLKKFINDVSLISQPFVINPRQSVGEVLIEHRASITHFIRFELGEGVAKN